MEHSYDDALFQLRDYNNYTLLGLIGDRLLPSLLGGERTSRDGKWETQLNSAQGENLFNDLLWLMRRPRPALQEQTSSRRRSENSSATFPQQSDRDDDDDSFRILICYESPTITNISSSPPALLPFRSHQKLGKLSSSPGSECVYPRQGRPNNSICAGGRRRRSVQEQFLTLPERTWAFIIIIPQQQKTPTADESDICKRFATISQEEEEEELRKQHLIRYSLSRY